MSAHRLHSSVTITFICTGKPKTPCNLFYRDSRFMSWSRAEHTVSAFCLYIRV